MTEIKVIDSHRNVMRRMQNAMQKNYLKVLTEPITNSDDSYRRLESKNCEENKKKPIIIFVTKKEKKFEVVDYGEGMDKEDLQKNFERYGSDKESHDSSSRGIFDQGLSDVLFTRKHGGHIFSIKDEQVYHAEFKWKTVRVGKELDQDRIIRIDDQKIKASKVERDNIKIPHGNGTNVTFHFTEAAFPSENEIVEKLNNYYVIRFINSNPNREVKVVFLENNKTVRENIICFSTLDGQKLEEIETDISYKDYKIHVKGSLYKAETELPQEEAGDERIGGLLIYDEYHNVYDLTLFGYDGNPHAKKFFGYVQLSSDYQIGKSKGFKQILRKELNEGEAVITDTRDGFVKSNKKNSLYFKLKEELTPLIKKFAEKETQEESESTSNLSKRSIEEHKKAFELLSDLYKRYNKIKILGTDIGKADKKPENGLEFDRKTAIIKKENKYYIGIRVDIDKIPKGSKIYISRDNENIKYQPQYFEVESGNKFGIYKKNIVISGTLNDFETKQEGNLSAKYKEQYESKIRITILEEEIYTPINGFEFYPQNYRSKQNSVNKLQLYVNKDFVPLGANIKFRILDGEKLTLNEFDQIQFEEKHLIDNTIGLIKIPYIGYKDKVSGQVEASFESKITVANIKITYQPPPEQGHMFEGWDYKPLPPSFETFYNQDTRKIEINSNIELNKKFLGKDLPEAQERYEKFLHCQILVAERILDECVTASIYTANSNGKLDLRDDQKADILNALRRIISQEKTKISPKILEHFIKEENLKLIENNLKNPET